MMLGLKVLFRIPVRLISKTGYPIISSLQKFSTVEWHHHLVKNQTRRFSEDTTANKYEVENPPSKHQIGKIEGRLLIEFTCKKCDFRSSKTISKLAYKKGIVIIRCDGCKNNHLIADNLGWFGENNKPQNIEKLMKLKGETVRRISKYGNDTFEVIENQEVLDIKSVNKA
ncbi:DNL-type zinc finger protein [Microplitis demolitor]|uniref:DNL-type zinc finger protein n=1 Tax=Microplitis demolitor TaxID=69319 RepID=UPI000440030B|nr:DNL-type zinc finger protein [Microplitis demolitor]